MVPAIGRCESAPDLAARFYGTAPQEPRRPPPCPSASSSAPATGRAARSLATPDEAALRTPVASYLRLFGLGQYAAAYVDAGLGGLGALSRMPEAESVEFAEQLPLYPGHMARLLSAVGLLRQAAALGGREQAALQSGPPGEVRMLEQLCTRLELIALERRQAEEQRQALQQENRRLTTNLARATQRIAELERLAHSDEVKFSRGRIAELEKLVWTQTEKVSFLAGHLQRLVGPRLATSDPWLSQFVEQDQVSCGLESAPLTPSESWHADAPAGEAASWTTAPGVTSAVAPEAQAPPQVVKPSEPTVHATPSRVAEEHCQSDVLRRDARSHSIDAEVAQSVAGQQYPQPWFEEAADQPITPKEEQVLLCFVAAIEHKLVVGVAQRSACASAVDSELSAAVEVFRMTESSLMGSADAEARTSAVPSRHSIQAVLLDMYQTLHLQAEVLVIAQVFLDRFTERSGMPVMPDTWQNVLLAALILASKVWEQSCRDNSQLAFVVPFDVEEIDAFENVFLRFVRHDIVLTASMYNNAHFKLESLKGKGVNFLMPRLDSAQAADLEANSRRRQAQLLQCHMRFEPPSPGSSDT